MWLKQPQTYPQRIPTDTAKMTNDCRFLATTKNESNRVNSFILEKSYIGISVPMQNTFCLRQCKKHMNE